MVSSPYSLLSSRISRGASTYHCLLHTNTAVCGTLHSPHPRIPSVLKTAALTGVRDRQTKEHVCPARASARTWVHPPIPTIQRRFFRSSTCIANFFAAATYFYVFPLARHRHRPLHDDNSESVEISLPSPKLRRLRHAAPLRRRSPSPCRWHRHRHEACRSTWDLCPSRRECRSLHWMWRGRIRRRTKR